MNRVVAILSCMCLLAASPMAAEEGSEIDRLRAEIAVLRAEIAALRQDVDRLQQTFGVARPGAEAQQKLEAAIGAGDAAAVQALLAQKMNPNLKLPSGKLPLEAAVDAGRPDVFKLILAANPNPRLKASTGLPLASYVKAKGGVEMIEAARAQQPDWSSAMETAK